MHSLRGLDSLPHSTPSVNWEMWSDHMAAEKGGSPSNRVGIYGDLIKCPLLVRKGTSTPAMEHGSKD